MPAFAMDMEMRDSFEPVCSIVVLEDTNGDGRMDKRTVFMDKLILPRAIKVLANGVLVGESPNLWFVQDTDGDLKADRKELVRSDFGRKEANIEHNAKRPLLVHGQHHQHFRTRLEPALEARQQI